MATEHLNSCPPLDCLEAVVLSGFADEGMSAHIRDCAECRTSIEEIRENEKLLAMFRSAGLSRGSSRTSGGEPVYGECTPHIDGYSGLERCGSGGQGVVYRALHDATKRVVALKVMLQGVLATSRQRRRFEREVELIASLRHENIVTVYDGGVASNQLHFLAMEWVDGRPIDTYVADEVRGREEGARKTLRLFSQVCSAVSCAHQRGVIHRDIKPANILVDDNGVPRVLDFGLAKSLQSSAENPGGAANTLVGEFKGTLAYAAPEQLLGDSDAIDVRTDVYALGVVLYELLTGEHPHGKALATPELIIAITHDEPRPPSAAARRTESGVAVSLDREIDAIVLKSMAKDPARRYQSAHDLRRELDDYLAGRPIDACRDSTAYLLTKLARRHLLACAVAVSGMIVTIAFATTVSLLYRRARIETAKADQMKVFLEDMLSSAEPSKHGQEVTVRDALDEAARWVDSSLEHQPELEAYVHNTIGNTYRSLGMCDDSELHLTKAKNIRIRMFGEDHVQVAQSLNSLALLANTRGDYIRAEQFAREAIAIQRAQLGGTDLRVAMTLNNLAYILRDAGRLDDAEQAFRESLVIRRGRLGPEHPDVAVLLYHLGRLAADAGNIEKATKLHREALAIRRMTLPARHPDLPRSLIALGDVLATAGKAREAEPLLREARSVREQNSPTGHWKRAEADAVLGRCLHFLHRSDEAEVLLTTSFDTLLRVRGSSDPLTVRAAHMLVSLHTSLGNPAQADAYRKYTQPDDSIVQSPATRTDSR